MLAEKQMFKENRASSAFNPAPHPRNRPIRPVLNGTPDSWKDRIKLSIELQYHYSIITICSFQGKNQRVRP